MIQYRKNIQTFLSTLEVKKIPVRNKNNSLFYKPIKNSCVVNLSKRKLTEDEITLLDLGLTFCPSVKNVNKEQVASDFFSFIRRLKLFE